MNKEITITKEKFLEIAAEVASKDEMGLIHAMFVAKLTYELFDKEESETEEEQETKEEFKPHLVSNRGKKLGNIGEETPLTALENEPLFVGDVVEVYDTETKQTLPLTQVCKNEMGYWVMALQLATLGLKNGKVDEWRIKKVKSYKELQHGEEYHNTRVILKENENE